MLIAANGVWFWWTLAFLIWLAIAFWPVVAAAVTPGRGRRLGGSCLRHGEQNQMAGGGRGENQTEFERSLDRWVSGQRHHASRN